MHRDALKKIASQFHGDNLKRRYGLEHGMTNRLVLCHLSVITGWDMVTKRALQGYDATVTKAKIKALSESEGNGMFNGADEKRLSRPQ